MIWLTRLVHLEGTATHWLGPSGLPLLRSGEKWWTDSATGKLKKRPAALKIVSCATEQQAALLNREAANLRAMSWQEEEGRQISVPFAPLLFDQFRDGDTRQGTLAMRWVFQARLRPHS